MRDFSGFHGTEVITLQDMVHSMTMRCGVTAPTNQSNSRIVKAIQSAIRALHSKHKWAYYRRQTRFKTSPMLTMEIEYDHTGGAEERLVTITDGDDWPSDATAGELQVGENSYRILKRISATQATLELDFSPSADYEGSATWRRKSYSFTRNLHRVDYARSITANRQLTHIPPGEIPSSSYNDYTLSRYFSWQNHGNEFGSTEFILYPAPTSEEIIEVCASILPHTPKIHSTTGNDLSGTSGTLTVSCSGGAFGSNLIGSILRVSTNAEPPVQFKSENYDFQAFITAVPSSTTLTISEALPASYASRGYVISSPIDAEVSTMLEALEDEAFYQYTKNHNHQGLTEAAAIAQKSLREAMVRANKTGEDSMGSYSPWYDPIQSIEIETEP
jgi:hypothetical protein